MSGMCWLSGTFAAKQSGPKRNAMERGWLTAYAFVLKPFLFVDDTGA